VNIAHLVEEELGIEGVVLGRQLVVMRKLKVLENAIQKVLVKDPIIRGENVTS